MYLHRLQLDLAHPQARRDLADPYQMHCTLARAFSPDDETPPCKFLWRTETYRGTRPLVLVQSADAGHWQRVFEHFPGYSTQIDHKAIDWAGALQTGRVYRFRVRANPTVTRGGKRHGLVREEDQVAWLSRQGSRLGFRVQSCLVSGRQRLEARRRKSGDKAITVLACQFDGTLEVVEVAALMSAISDGIGHAKSLGLGLLSLARA